MSTSQFRAHEVSHVYILVPPRQLVWPTDATIGWSSRSEAMPYGLDLTMYGMKPVDNR